MKIIRFLKDVFRHYESSDKVISFAALAVILLLILKLIIFPYGFFGFGESEIYTEGLVSKNGIQSINPLFVDYNEADREISRLVFSGLMKYDPDTQTVKEDMATLTINEDKTIYTFKLRDGLTWHDGEPVTADDVVFTFDHVIKSEGFQNEILKTNFAGVGIEKIDDKTVQFTLENPNVFFATNFITGLLPEHILADTDPADLLQADFNKMPIGTGPYMVEEAAEKFQDGRSQITLSRNPNYYDEQSEVEFMRFIVYPTTEELLEEVDSVNGVPKVSGNYFVEFQNHERFDLIPYELPQYTAVFMNLESAVFENNKAIRLAMRKAIDKDELVSGLSNKVAVSTPLMQLEQDKWVTEQDLDEAKAILEGAGYDYGPDDTEQVGIRYSSDESALEINLIARLYEDGSSQFEETNQVISYLQEVWESIGIGVKVDLLDSDEFNSRVTSRAYDVVLIGQSLGYNLDTYSYWHSTQATISGQNFSNYKSFQVDTLIENIRSSFDVEQRNVRLQELAQQIFDDIPAIFLYRPQYYYASDGKISGISMDGVVFPNDRFARISQWEFNR